MRLLLVADTYPPSSISGALQMRDLAAALAGQGHRPVVLTPTNEPGSRISLEEVDGVQTLRVRTPRTKDVGLIRRALAECVLPWMLLRGLRNSHLGNEHWDGVVWYSPTIFLGALAKALKRTHRCPGYLILRDLFPDWAVDAGVMRKGGLAYRFFKAVERFQYRQADVIGVQTPSNAPLVALDTPTHARIEVLHNWLAVPVSADDVVQDFRLMGHLEGKVIFVYAGNMGVAQDMDAFVELARRMRANEGVGFLFVGRGSELARLRAIAERDIPNLLVLDEVSPALLPALLARCHVGIVALHPLHATHNIPGKLLTYLHAGLPVLARVNAGNDLAALVERENIGLVVQGDAPALLHAHALRLATDPQLRKRMGAQGSEIAQRLFSPASAASQIVDALHECSLARRQ